MTVDMATTLLQYISYNTARGTNERGKNSEIRTTTNSLSYGVKTNKNKKGATSERELLSVDTKLTPLLKPVISTQNPPAHNY